MQEKLLFIILGALIISVLVNVYVIKLLYKKPSTVTNNEIENLKQKNKHNKNSTIDNNIHAEVSNTEEKKRKRRRLNKLFNKKK